jgi:hypothetical protein
MKNRWLIALSAVGIHISIGSVYAWSNFTTPLMIPSVDQRNKSNSRSV